MRRKAKTMVPPLQQVDFDALPYSVQRKYFSSLERLQIRQQSLEEYAASSGRSSRASSSAYLRPSLTLSSQRQSRSAQGSSRCDDLPSTDIEFFLSLPEKVRKLYFSRDEQHLLLDKCERDSLGQTHHHDFERVRQRFSDFRFGFPRDQDDDSSYSRGRLRRRSLSLVSRVSLSPASSNFTAQEKDWDMQSSLFHLDSMSSPRRVQRSMQHSEVRRTMSFSTAPRHYSTSSAMIFGASPAVLMADPPVFTMQPTLRHHRAHSSTSTSVPSSSNTPTTPIFDPEATHYQDPEARKKLRMYLASPQKFDEAIEFGFPSTAEHGAVGPHYQLPPITSHSRKFSRDMQTFLKDGKLSFFEDNGSVNQGLDSDEEASVPDTESPVTPSSIGMTFHLHSRHVSHSKESSDGAMPTVIPSGGNLNREMTLRMTLTRPDLRADDDQLYGWQNNTTQSTPRESKDDPLALEDLILTDDMTGTKGPFYVKPRPKGNMVTRMLKRASLKVR